MQKIKNMKKSINIFKRCLTNFNKLDFPRDKEIKLKLMLNLAKMFRLHIST